MKIALSIVLVVFGLGWVPAVCAAPTTNGLYVTFQTTQGEFSCILYYQQVPRTVANFVGLVSGAKRWLDSKNGALRQSPFYNGLTFHRVVKNFVIQGGSPNALGTDDPGYQFKDEFHPALRHSRAGVLSMANSGPDSNGSQFFITMTNTPSLNDKHSVFGLVIEGMPVVRKIENVPVGAKSKPVSPVVMTNLFITRIGTNAIAWDPSTLSRPLPELFYVKPRIAKLNESHFLFWDLQPDTVYRLFTSRDLVDWVDFGPGEGGLLDSLVQENEKYFFLAIGSPNDP